MRLSLLMLVLCLPLSRYVAAGTAEDSWQAGVASVDITPQKPLPMSGYASRKEPSEGTEQRLFAKALAIQDASGNRVVFVTMDLIGVLARFRTAVLEKVNQQHKLPSHALVMNASHTHCGPAYGRDEAKDYYRQLTSKVVALIDRSIRSMAPASVRYSQARCGFAMNRRTPTESGYRNHPNPYGPVDHTVPVLRVDNAEGELRAVMFGYACHNTTMGFRRWLGDYAGYAQEYLEEDHPGVTALFLNGCGGDQNPYPRSKLEYARKHGRSLATAVEAALEVGQRTLRHQRPVQGEIRTVLEPVDLSFTTADRSDFAYPVQVVRLGNTVTVIALGSEVVVDYALRLKRILAADGGPATWVAGYSNVYDGYIPSRRVLLEGGYEAASRPWRPELEVRIIGKTHELVKRISDSN